VHKLIKAVRDLAEEHPDALYYAPPEGCLYTLGSCGGGQGCIVGQAVLRVYPELLEILIKVDMLAVDANTLFDDELPDLDLSHEDIGWLGSVQSNQDHPRAWGVSVTQADKEIE
jgi:hypothetical protein